MTPLSSHVPYLAEVDMRLAQSLDTLATLSAGVVCVRVCPQKLSVWFMLTGIPAQISYKFWSHFKKTGARIKNKIPQV
jgi:hypothetical protein